MALEFTDWAVEILRRSHEAARRFNPDATVRVRRDGDRRRVRADRRAARRRRARGARGLRDLGRGRPRGHRGHRRAPRPAHPSAPRRSAAKRSSQLSRRPSSTYTSSVTPAHEPSGPALRSLGGAGPVMLIGGAEDKVRNRVILSRFVGLRRGGAGRGGRRVHRLLARRPRHRSATGSCSASSGSTGSPACGPRSASRRRTPRSGRPLDRATGRVPHRREPAPLVLGGRGHASGATRSIARTTAARCSPAPRPARARWRRT